MNARLNDYRMLWRAAVTHANPRLSGIFRWGGGFLVLVIGAAAAYNYGARSALAWFWAAGSGFLLLDWAWRFMPGAVKLATPANAKLVPQMRRRLVELSCLLCFVGVAGIASAPYADADSLGGWLFWVVVFIVGTGLGASGHRAGAAIVTTACFSTLFIDRLPDALIATLSHPFAVLLALPLYAGVILVAVRAMLPEGGERHWAMLARRARWTGVAGKPDPLLEEVGGKGARNWYARSLRRDSARRDGRRLVLHALGPSHHLGETTVGLSLMVGVFLCIGLFAGWRSDSDVLPDIGWAVAAILLFIPIAQAVRLGQLPLAHASEQALVRLAPVAPADAPTFNLQLGRSLMLRVLAGWAMTSEAALFLAALGGAQQEALLRLASLCCMVLPVVAVPLRDHASRRQSAGGVAATLLLVATVEASLVGGVVNAFTGFPALPVAALVSIGYTVYAVARGLRTLRAAPCAYPAGRMD